MITIKETLDEFQMQVADLAKQGKQRQLRDFGLRTGSQLSWQGKNYLNCSSNDYLGLGTDQALQRQFLATHQDKIEQIAAGSTASRLMAGADQAQLALEDQLEQAYGRPALLFNSGYHANLGILPTLSAVGDVVFADKLIHASMIDGLKLSGAQFFRYHHADLCHLDLLLAKHRHKFKRAFVLTESIFSMDGDRAALADLIALKNKYQALLYLDEAHACGLLGPEGLGLASELGLVSEVDLLIGTWGKAWASMGAFVIAQQSIKDLLINRSRPLIYSTCLPPFSVAWNSFIFAQRGRFGLLRQRVRELAQSFARALGQQGQSPIVPLIVGSEQQVILAWQDCLNAGMLALPVRPPTVLEGTCRLRFSLRADMTDADLALLCGWAKDWLAR